MLGRNNWMPRRFLFQKLGEDENTFVSAFELSLLGDIPTWNTCWTDYCTTFNQLNFSRKLELVTYRNYIFQKGHVYKITFIFRSCVCIYYTSMHLIFLILVARFTNLLKELLRHVTLRCLSKFGTLSWNWVLIFMALLQ